MYTKILYVEMLRHIPSYTGHFIMFSVITNMYNKKTKDLP